MSDRAENLEAIEMRLKNDILQEANRFGGLVLTHNEMGASQCLYPTKVVERAIQSRKVEMARFFRHGQRLTRTMSKRRVSCGMA